MRPTTRHRHLNRPLTALLFIAMTIIAACAYGADDAPRLRATPEQIALQPGLLSHDIVLVFEPPKAATIRAAHLRWLPTTGLEIQQLTAPTFPGTSDGAWTIRLTATRLLPKEATVVFVLDYQVEPPAAATGTPAGVERSAILVATARIAYSALTVQQAIKVSIERGFDSLVPDSPQLGYLVVENTDVTEVALESTTVLSPDFLEVVICPREQTKGAIAPGCLPAVIPGRGTARLPLRFTARERIPPGSTPLLLDVAFSRKAPGGSVERATIGLVHPVQASIPGLADIKTLLQVPSLLFLPGTLVVLAWGLLWRAGLRLAGSTEFFLKPTTGEFYLVSITLSGAIAYAYSRYVIGETAGLLEAVSMRDVARIWFGSIVLGTMTYLLCMAVDRGIAYMHRKAAERERRARDPQPNDKPPAILGKLSGPSLQLETYNYRPAAGKQQLVFDLGFVSADQKIWVSPQCLVTIARDPGTLADAFDAIGTCDELALFLEQHGASCTIDWVKGGILTDPTPIATNDLGPARGRQMWVRRS